MYLIHSNGLSLTETNIKKNKINKYDGVNNMQTTTIQNTDH